MPQCLGKTKQGNQCKKQVAHAKFCHYHTNQAGGTSTISAPSPSGSGGGPPKYKIHLSTNPNYNHGKPEKNEGQGFMYIYTLTHLLLKSPKQADWLKIQVSPSKWENFNPANFILVKIGLTTTLVNKRIGQWRDQCHHDITIIEPNVLKDSSDTSLLSLFKGLNFKENTKKLLMNMGNKERLNHSELKCFRANNNGFYCGKNLAEIETMIHKSMREKYGKVELYCDNCSSVVHGKKIHREWFLVPRTSLVTVFYLVDKISYKLGGGAD